MSDWISYFCNERLAPTLQQTIYEKVGCNAHVRAANIVLQDVIYGTYNNVNGIAN